MRDLIFTLLLGSGEDEDAALRLARSLRTFGGQYSFSPIWMLCPRSEDELSEATRQELFSIGARLVTLDIPQKGARFPFASYVTAAGIAEGLAQGETRYLVLMAADTLVLQEPDQFLLPVGKSVGVCPVHLKLIGSGADEPVNDFWNLIYQLCQVNEDHVFTMQSLVDEQPIRAYFNAGLIIVRPERGLLRGWQAKFERLYRSPEFETFYLQSELYQIFMHQAVLAGCLLSALRPDEFQLLPPVINYPLHLHAKMPEKNRPSRLNDLVTCRYEEYRDTFNDPLVQELLERDDQLKIWLNGW